MIAKEEFQEQCNKRKMKAVDDEVDFFFANVISSFPIAQDNITWNVEINSLHQLDTEKLECKILAYKTHSPSCFELQLHP